ncbi:hypothetical protein RUND412_010919, partial [Rhizina undulata]
LLANLHHEKNASNESDALRAEIEKLRAENQDLRNTNDQLENKLDPEYSYTNFQQEVAQNTVRESDTLEDKVAYIQGTLINFGRSMRELFQSTEGDMVHQWAESTLEIITVICDDSLRISNGDDIVGLMLGEIEFAESACVWDMEVRAQISKFAEEYDE